jgi:hypothetical protein
MDVAGFGDEAIDFDEFERIYFNGDAPEDSRCQVGRVADGTTPDRARAADIDLTAELPNHALRLPRRSTPGADPGLVGRAGVERAMKAGDGGRYLA